MSIKLSKANFLKIIEKIAQRAEANLFLEEFRSIPKAKFAVIYIEKSILSSQLLILAHDIAIINQLNIYPILVCAEQHLMLQEEINQQDGAAKYLNHKNIEIETIKAIAQQGFSLIINGKNELAEKLVQQLAPKKYIVLTQKDGVEDENGKILPFLNIAANSNFAEIKNCWVPLLTRIKHLLEVRPECAVVITSTAHLLKEIFTVKGSGTFLKSHHILSTIRINKVNTDKLKELLEDAFQRTLQPNYFEGEFLEIFYQKDYEGAAVIQKINGFAYLDKFAVGTLFQGTGLGKSLWEKIGQKYPKLIWRANPTNPFNSFYLKECQGCLKYADWYIFWKGLNLQEILAVEKQIREKPVTLQKQVNNEKIASS